MRKVEPNPGPAARSEASLPKNLCWSVNVDGATHAFELLPFVDELMPGILCVQETNFDDSQRTRWLELVRKKGYRAWASKVKNNTSASGQALHFGGLAVAVRHDLEANFLSEWTGPGGDILTIVTPELLLSCLWRRPGSESDDFIQELTEISESFSQLPWIAIGDWNWTPSENEAATLGHLCPVMHNNIPVPTRWYAKRAVDYALVTSHSIFQASKLHDTVLGDHKIYEISFHHTPAGSPPKSLRRTVNFFKPTDMAQEKWDEVLNDSFRNFEAPQHSSTELEWSQFCQAITDCLTKALPDHGLQKSNRPLGSLPSVVDTNFAFSTFRSRKLAKFLGRVREVIRQRSTAEPELSLLRHVQHTWPHEIPKNCSFVEVENRASSLLEAELQSIRNSSIKQWRHRMATDDQATTRWLLENNSTLPPEVKISDPNHPTGKSNSYQEALQAIRSFWQSYWNREEVCNRWRAARGPTHRLHIPVPTPLELQKAAKLQRGSAAGLDGFSGSLIADLPECVWEVFHDLVSRWLERGEVPCAWKQIRQIHIPKEHLSLNEPVHPSKLRPISIMSTWWRASSVAKSQNVRSWLKAVARESAHGGIQGREAFHGILALESRWRQNKGIIVSQDFEKCFDSICPNLAINILVTAGFPRLWAAMLESVWRDQYRWLTFGACCIDSASHVNRSIPQGDALSPLAVIVLLSAPLQELSDRYPDIRTSGFIDDRVSVVTRPTLVPELLNFWSDWASLFKMLENSAKTKIVPHTAKQKQSLENLQIPRDFITNNKCRVLGVDFCSRINDTSRPSCEARQTQTIRAAHRLKTLPVTESACCGALGWFPELFGASVFVFLGSKKPKNFVKRSKLLLRLRIWPHLISLRCLRVILATLTLWLGRPPLKPCGVVVKAGCVAG